MVNNNVESTTGYATDLMTSEMLGLHFIDSTFGSDKVPCDLTVGSAVKVEVNLDTFKAEA